MTTHTYDTLRYPPHHNTTTKYTHNACYAICRYPQGLGVKSTLYIKFMKEEVDLERECARYAIQALVATHFFRQKAGT